MSEHVDGRTSSISLPLLLLPFIYLFVWFYYMLENSISIPTVCCSLLSVNVFRCNLAFDIENLLRSLFTADFTNDFFIWCNSASVSIAHLGYASNSFSFQFFLLIKYDLLQRWISNIRIQLWWTRLSYYNQLKSLPFLSQLSWIISIQILLLLRIDSLLLLFC